jgi:hypothetical protein
MGGVKAMIAKEAKDETCPVESDAEDAPVVVEASFPIQAAALFLSLFGLAFTLIPAGILVAASKKGWDGGLICPGLFLVIGLIFDLIAVYLILKCFNPKPVMVLTEQAIYPGSEVEVGWMFRGKTASIQHLKLELIGTEKVSYRQGTSTRTEESIFHRSTLLETSEPAEIAKGFCMARIPSDSMHSFKSKNNEIRWQFSLHGTIARWPDVGESFPLQVLTPPVPIV